MYTEKGFREIPKGLRPREKLIKHGPEVLTEEELLAIILGSGTQGLDVLSLSREIIKMGWERLSRMTVQEIAKELKGVGTAKACQIKATIELSKRLSDPYHDVKISSPSEVYRVVKDKVDDRREHLIALYLSPSNRLLGHEVIAIGRMNSLYAEPKDILHTAVKLACSSIIVVHNHPKGELKPSKEDIEFTRRLKDACRLLGFDLLDHLIINEKGYLSLRSEGYL